MVVILGFIGVVGDTRSPVMSRVRAATETYYSLIICLIQESARFTQSRYPMVTVPPNQWNKGQSISA